MKLCILECTYESSDSPMRDWDPPSDPEFYFSGHQVERHFIPKKNAGRCILELASRDFDFFVNLCDGAWDEDRAGIEVVWLLEKLQVPFTGAGSSFYDPTRETMKMVCRYAGIGVPEHVTIQTLDDIAEQTAHLRYPLIVKHPNSYSSIGLTPKSRVTNPAALCKQARIMIERFGAAMVEEFIDGREFSVLVAEHQDPHQPPHVFTPIEIIFTQGETFKHFDLKWKTYDKLLTKPVVDPELAKRLKDAAARLFEGLNGTGYGRCDLRMDHDGNPFMLEINPNCGIFYAPEEEGTADLILQNDPGGHALFVDLILQAARNRPDHRNWNIRYSQDQGYQLLACRPIDAQEIILPFEGRAHYLVSRQEVERTWDEQHKAWFHRYAWPLTDEIYVTWSPNPENWRPVNHSCDPNAWLDGLDVVARRPIRPGEAITLDYATFCNEIMESFTCRCGSTHCRRTIRGTDYLEPFVERYGAHLSDYVRMKRAVRI